MATVGAPVTGSWKKSAFFYDRPGALHVADPRHAEPGQEPAPGDFSHQAGAVPPGPAGTEYFGSERVSAESGPVLDNTGSSHSDGYDWPVARTTVEDLDSPGDGVAELHRWTTRAHSRRTRAANYDELKPKFHDESRVTWRVEGFPVEVTDSLSQLSGGGMRGWSGTVNNPPLESYGGRGYRYGWTEWQRDLRKFAVRIIQRPDARAWSPNTAYVEGDTKAKASPYNVPFPALARVIENVFKRPELRRESPDLADTLAAGGVQPPSPTEQIATFWVQ